jgi:hypothetical protein
MRPRLTVTCVKCTTQPRVAEQGKFGQTIKSWTWTLCLQTTGLPLTMHSWAARPLLAYLMKCLSFLVVIATGWAPSSLVFSWIGRWCRLSPGKLQRQGTPMRASWVSLLRVSRLVGQLLASHLAIMEMAAKAATHAESQLASSTVCQYLTRLRNCISLTLVLNATNFTVRLWRSEHLSSFQSWTLKRTWKWSWT